MAEHGKLRKEAELWLARQYRAGRTFANRDEILAALTSAEGPLSRCTVETAVEIDRRARYLLADERTFVTPPVRITGYERTPNATVDLRRKTLQVRDKDLLTRARNVQRMRAAAAAQRDHSEGELRQVAEIGVAVRVLESLLSA